MLRSDAKQNRALLLDAACELIAQVGTDDISARDIADRAGVSTATLYRHFPSKQALVDCISVDRWERMSEWARGSQSPRSAVFDIARVLDRFSRLVSDDAQFIQAAGLKVGATPAAIAPVRELFDARFSELWSAARASGSVRRWSDPRDAVELVGSIRNRERRVPMLATIVAGFVAPQIDVERVLRTTHRSP
ncbi:TetR/AcrR family transcriptional regulator [Microbacterium caowuchunii]|nr:TetR/AcrR family transcriptional regulator [Microbacterium caowuchunii]